jgi:hypothetical protein
MCAGERAAWSMIRLRLGHCRRSARNGYAMIAIGEVERSTINRCEGSHSQINGAARKLLDAPPEDAIAGRPERDVFAGLQALRRTEIAALQVSDQHRNRSFGYRCFRRFMAYSGAGETAPPRSRGVTSGCSTETKRGGRGKRDFYPCWQTLRFVPGSAVPGSRRVTAADRLPPQLFAELSAVPTVSGRGACAA